MNTNAVQELDRFDSLDFENKKRVLQDAFDDLSVPSFYGGPRIPDTFIPEGEPYVRGLEQNELVKRFMAKDAFRLLPEREASKMDPEKVQAERSRRLLLQKRMRSGALSAENLKASQEESPSFGNYLSLSSRGYPLNSLSSKEIHLCQNFVPCLSEALARRHPSYKDALILLFRYANGLPFTRKSEKYSMRRLGYFIRLRQVLKEQSVPLITKESIAQIDGQTTGTATDVEVLKLLRLHQWEAVHRSQMMSIFLSVITGLMAFLFWRVRPRKKKV
jgi:hypothetical protein